MEGSGVSKAVKIGDRWVGEGHAVYVIAEIGINHNGSVEIAKRLIDAAVEAGCNAVKMQKRTPELCVPMDQRGVIRETPWGRLTYLEYRYRTELGLLEYQEIDGYCREKKIQWFASCWDTPSVDFIERFEPPCYKIASATLTNTELLHHLRSTGRPLILSTGMSTMEQIEKAIDFLGTDHLIITHCTSTYACPPSELNLRMIETLSQRFPCPVGYSGHEVGLPTTVAAVALGACLIERHITLDRAMWGSDHAASVEPRGFQRLVKYIRTVETAMGDGTKEVYPSEMPILRRLRGEPIAPEPSP
jgi:N-acetylneuraminate synthase